MRLSHTLLVPLCLSMSSVAMAEDPAPAPAPAPAADAAGALDVTADLRSEYIAGHKLLVQLEARNEGAASVQFPDLSARPWLVTFQLEDSAGKRQERRTRAPAEDPGKLVTIAPRGQRNTLLEIPGSAAIDPGTYTIGVVITTPDGPLQLPSRQINIAAAKPVDAMLDAAPSSLVRDELHALWLHQATDGYDLYLHQAKASAPDAPLGNWYLTHLDKQVAPQLTAARAAQSWDRHIYWTASDRKLVFARLGGKGLRSELADVEAPWPQVELAGRGGTDGDGGLHVPIWVPAPTGARGELRVLSIGDRGTPTFQRAALLDARPTHVETVVDDAGSVHFLVVTATFADLYTVRSAPGTGAEALPIPARRIARAEPGETLLRSAFAALPQTETHAGGLATLLLASNAEGLQSRWLTLRGQVIQTLPAQVGLSGEVLGLVPRGLETPGLVLGAADGTAQYQSGAKSTTLGKLPTDWALVGDADRVVHLRTIGSPVTDKTLNP